MEHLNILKQKQLFKETIDWKLKNICITSGGEIQEGNYVPWNNQIFKVDSQNAYSNTNNITLKYAKKYCEKIILTTDQDLIKDGVQAIDDEFLEWFVKNPSCEEIETSKGSYSLNSMEKMLEKEYVPKGTFDTYKLIIPKEETNWDELNNSGLDKPFKIIEDHKLKTLEAAAKEYSELIPFVSEIVTDNSRLDFIAGAKWQQEQDIKRFSSKMLNTLVEDIKGQQVRSYSEEEVKEIIISCKNRFSGGDLEDYHSDSEVIKWFEQYKNRL